MKRYGADRFCGIIGTVVVICLWCIFFCFSVQAHSNQRVLFISSYSYDFFAVSHQIDGLKEGLGSDFDINYAFMDAKHKGSILAERDFYQEMLRFKDTHGRYDAVILGDDDALNFARTYRKVFFDGLPLIFEGINIEENAQAAHVEGMTGVIETVPFFKTIEGAVRLRPGADKIVMLIDRTPTGQGLVPQFFAVQKEFPQLTFSVLDESAYSEVSLAETLESIGEDTIVLLGSFNNDGDGNHYTSEQGPEFLASHLHVPFFAVTELGLGYGALGGTMIATWDMGYKAALMTRSILLEGTKPEDIPLERMEGTDIYDKKQLDRFGISVSRLPEGTRLINEPENLLVTYRYIIGPAIFAFIILLAWLAREIWNNRKHKQMLAQMTASGTMMRIALKQSGMMAWVYDIEKRSIQYEQGNTNLFNEDVPETDIPDSIIAAGYIHTDDENIFRHLYAQLQAGDKMAEATFRWLLPEKGFRWLRCIYTVIFDAEGRPVKAFGTGLDVTGEKKREERFNAELRRIAALEGETLGRFYFDLETGELFNWMYEDASISMEGISAYAMIERTARRIPDDDERARYVRFLRRPYLIDQYEQGNSQVTMEYRYEDKTGQLLWVRTHVYLSRRYDTGRIAAYIYTSDITSVMDRQMALDSVIDEEVEFIGLIQLQNRVERVIKARKDASFRTGDTLSYEQELAILTKQVVAEDQEVTGRYFALEHILEVLQKNESVTGYYRIADALGKLRRKRALFYFLDERRQSLVHVDSDITALYEEEQKQKQQLQEALKKAETASRAKSDFLSHMSHEIRTPMNAIIGLATLIAGKSNDAAYVTENIEKVHMSAQFLLSLINDILDISRIESGRMELNESDVLFEHFIHAINTLVKSRADEKHIIYKSVLSEQLARAYHFDELKLKQVLINILSNAVKFTADGGTVKLQIENAGPKGEGDCLRFRISDTGIGIDPAFLPKIFDAFAQEYSSNTTLYGGTGLGLAISQNIIRLMGGTIRVGSVKGKGTTFIVELVLPRVTSERAEHLESLTSDSLVPYDAADFVGKRILLAEDNDINREIAETVLKEAGLCVDAVVNGQDAVEAYLSHESGYYDAILMDVRMPVMDGLEAARRIRFSMRDDALTVPILALTANAFEEDMKKSLAAGMNFHLTKPIEPATLFRCLQGYLGKKGK